MKMKLKRIITYLIYIQIALIILILTYLVVAGETIAVFISGLLVILIFMIILYFVLQKREMEKRYIN